MTEYDQVATRDIQEPFVENPGRPPAAAGNETQAANEQPAAPARRGRRAGNARLAWGIAVLATAVAVGFAFAWAPLYSDAQERQRVREVATELALHLTTFDGQAIEEWVRDTQERSTEEYAQRVTTLFDQELRDALRQGEAISRGSLVNIFVQDIDGDEALVFAVVRQSISNAAVSQPFEDELRMQITLRNVDGRWLAGNVDVLGPGGGALPGPGAGAPDAGAPGDEPGDEPGDQPGDEPGDEPALEEAS